MWALRQDGYYIDAPLSGKLLIMSNKLKVLMCAFDTIWIVSDYRDYWFKKIFNNNNIKREWSLARRKNILWSIKHLMRCDYFMRFNPSLAYE